MLILQLCLYELLLGLSEVPAEPATHGRLLSEKLYKNVCSVLVTKFCNKRYVYSHGNIVQLVSIVAVKTFRLKSKLIWSSLKIFFLKTKQTKNRLHHVLIRDVKLGL